MHKLFIDINVVLDVALARQPHFNPSQKILSYIEIGKASGYISAISCATIYYLVKKEIDSKKAASFIRNLLELLAVVEVNKKTIEAAFEQEAKDFEDNIQIACAQACRANYIITRNAADYKNSSVSAISPSEYLAAFS